MAGEPAAGEGGAPDASTGVLVRFIGFFFLIGSYAGILTVYLPPYLKSLGFSSAEPGRLLAIPPVLTALAPLVWAQLADRYGARLALVRALLIALAVVFTAFHFAGTGAGVAAALIGMAVFRSGVLPLADAVALSSLSATQYVRIVITNGLSWIVATGLFAYLAADAPGAERWAVSASHVLIGITAAFAWLVTGKPQPAAERPSFADGVALLRDRRILRFLLALVVYWTGMGPFETLLAIHATEMGFGASAAGYAFGVAVAAEIAVMALARRAGFDLLGIAAADRDRSRRLMAAVMAATAARWLASSFASQYYIFLALQAIHGLSFGAFFLLAVGELRVLVPDGLRATGQALLFSSTAGLGGMLGALFAGELHGLGGSPLAFQAAGGASLLACLIVATSPRGERAAQVIRSG
jgi:PPP family 3-phenylpropionic acid transporter